MKAARRAAWQSVPWFWGSTNHTVGVVVSDNALVHPLGNLIQQDEPAAMATIFVNGRKVVSTATIGLGRERREEKRREERRSVSLTPGVRGLPLAYRSTHLLRRLQQSTWLAASRCCPTTKTRRLSRCGHSPTLRSQCSSLQSPRCRQSCNLLPYRSNHTATRVFLHWHTGLLIRSYRSTHTAMQVYSHCHAGLF